MKHITRIFALALALMLCAGALAATVTATAIVNLRTGPGRAYDTVDSVPEGTVLTYAGQTVADERPVDWYAVYWNGKVVWISSVYSVLKGADSETPTIDVPAGCVELSAYYMKDLKQSAKQLGLDEFHYEANSEVPNHYSDGAATIAGYSVAEYIGIQGKGYSLFGVASGMDRKTAKDRLTAAGLVFYGETATSLSFQHKAAPGQDVTGTGCDGIVDVALKGGKVERIDWSTYTG